MRLKAFKTELSNLLAAGTPNELWNADDWWDYFEERAAIREHDGALSHYEAERLAFAARPWRSSAALPATLREQHSHHGWPLTGIEPFSEPVPTRGAQGFWMWERSRSRDS